MGPSHFFGDGSTNTFATTQAAGVDRFKWGGESGLLEGKPYVLVRKAKSNRGERGSSNAYYYAARSPMATNAAKGLPHSFASFEWYNVMVRALSVVTGYDRGGAKGGNVVFESVRISEEGIRSLFRGRRKVLLYTTSRNCSRQCVDAVTIANVASGVTVFASDVYRLLFITSTTNFREAFSTMYSQYSASRTT